MQVAASPFSPSLPYHAYYQIQPPAQGTHDHELKRQYLSLLPPKQIIEICLMFDAYVPPYAKTTIWPPDFNTAIAGLQRVEGDKATSPVQTSNKDVVDEPKTQELSASAPETAEPPLKEKEPSASTSDPQSSAAENPPDETVPDPQPSSSESHSGLTSVAQIQSTPPEQNTQSVPPYPQQPYRYGHPQVAYPHAPYYPSSYPYPYSYPPPMNGYHGSTPALTPTPFAAIPPHPHPQPEAAATDDLPSYEEMIVEALSECTDPDGCAPKDLFTWMAARYPLQSNFRPSASQALQKAYKRGRFEKASNGKYRLSATWEGGNTSRRTTRRPQTQSHASSSSASRTAPPFTNAPLVHHHNHHPPDSLSSSHAPGHTPYARPYTYPGYGYPTHPPQQPIASASNAPGAESSSSSERTASAGDSASAYEAAQSILKAINFGDLLTFPPEEEQKREETSQQHLQPVGNGVEQLLSQVQAILASRNSEAAMTSALPSSETVQVAENTRAELQAQLALLSAQLSELSQIEESQKTDPQSRAIGPSVSNEPPMNSLMRDDPPPPPQPQLDINDNAPPMMSLSPMATAVAVQTSTNGSGVGVTTTAQEDEESDEDDMEAVI